MAVRTLICLLLVATLAGAVVPAASACFGPKLYIGVSDEPRQELLYALVSLYVAEKTGVESEKVPLASGADPAAEIAAERVDMVLAAAPVAGAQILLAAPGYPLLASGRRPLTDLQFTTVAPALRKLAGVLTVTDLATLEERVAGGEKPVAAARWLCREKRWL